jgi:hypothetical protein
MRHFMIIAAIFSFSFAEVRAQEGKCFNPPKTIQGKCAKQVGGFCQYNSYTQKWEWRAGVGNLENYRNCLRRNGIS